MEVNQKIFLFMADHTLSFPEDIIYNILSRLPIKSLARFRCVCKLWLEYINDSHLHTIHVKEEPRPIMLQDQSISRVDRKIRVNFLCGTTSLQRDPVLELCYNRSYYYYNNVLISSCNGLTMVCYEQDPCLAATYGFSVINPLSKERHDLPPISIKVSHRLIEYDHRPRVAAGIGFEDSTRTLKTMFSILKDAVVVCTMVHSPGMSSWREITQTPAYPIIGVGVYGHGRLHWLANGQFVQKIVWFDVKTEEFGLTTDLPQPEKYHWIFDTQLVDLNGEVGYAYIGMTCVKLWILKHEEWVLHCSFDPSLILPKYYDYDVKVSGYWNKDGDILLDCNNGEWLLVYTLKNGDLREVELRDLSEAHSIHCIRMYQSHMFSFHTSAYSWSPS